MFPPGPKGTWLGGNLRDFRRERQDFLTRSAREFGDVVYMRFAHRRIFLASHPDLIEEVLVTRNHDFIKHFALRLNPLLLGNGLLTSENSFWLRQRRLVQPAFIKSRLAGYAPAVVATTERLLAEWRAGEHREIHAEMMRLTLQIAAKTLFGSEATSDTRDVARALQIMQDNFLERFLNLIPPPLWLPTRSNRRFKRAVRRLDEIIYRFIRERRASQVEQHDVLSLLLRARDEEDGKGMSDQQVRDEAMTLFLAGHETTALTLSWTWYLLAQHPAAAEKLLAEIQSVLPGRLPTFDDVAKLRYTEAIVLEAMRLYPPAYVIGREAIRETSVGGYPVRRGMTVLMSQWVVQRDPRFFADPEAFRPERWLEESAKHIPKFAYFPFGGGPRLCVGNTFAMMEMALVLAILAPRFRFALEPGATVTPVASFTLHPVPGVPGVIEPR
ncbi:MAG: cytochrome P450 [Gemmataceae bacterium]|nr:cytochrome P450 [Gemmataceae bacterium]